MALMSCVLLCLLLMMLRKNEKQELATSGERKTSVVSLVLGVESARMCATTVCLRLVCEREDGFLSLFFIRLSSVLVHIVAHRWLRLAGISSASSPACSLACIGGGGDNERCLPLVFEFYRAPSLLAAAMPSRTGRAAARFFKRPSKWNLAIGCPFD